MNRTRLRELGFDLGERAVVGETQSAWFATAPDGLPVVLKWFPGSAMIERYAVLVPALDELRGRGVPVPSYVHVVEFDGGTLAAQSVLPGTSQDNPSSAAVDAMVECVAAKAGIPGPPPPFGSKTWGAFVVDVLTLKGPGAVMGAPLRMNGRRSAALLDRIELAGARARPEAFPDDGLVHADLHTDNVLIGDDGALTGIIDWEDACGGDHRFDLVAFAFDLDGHDQPTWDMVDRIDFEPAVLRAYVAYLALKGSSWAIRHHPDDVARQLDRAERVLARYGV